MGAALDLSKNFPNREGFTTREIAAGAGCSPQTVSNNKTFLVTSAKMMRETEDGLSLVHGADESWWAEKDLTVGLPSPQKARTLWDTGPRGKGPRCTKNAGQTGQGPKNYRNPDTYGEVSVQHPTGQGLDLSNQHNGRAPALASAAPSPTYPEPEGETGHVQPLSIMEVYSESGLDKPDPGDDEGLSTLSSGFGVQDDAYDPGVEI